MHEDDRAPTEPFGELRWRAYLDHLEDLGYDLSGNAQPEPAPVPAPERRTLEATQGAA